jgi:hypothetical protein
VLLRVPEDPLALEVLERWKVLRALLRLLRLLQDPWVLVVHEDLVQRRENKKTSWGLQQRWDHLPALP